MKYGRAFKYLGIGLLVAACGNDQGRKSNETSDSNTVDENVPVAVSIVSQDINYQADSLSMKGFIAYDENISVPRPGIIIVHEWWGHNDHVRNTAMKLAEEGYIALAVDMYGNGKVAAHPEDAKAFAGEVLQDFEVARKRFDAAMDVLRSHSMCDAHEIAAVGYCFGGGIVLNMARQASNLDAVASFHGSLTAAIPASPGSVKARILVMNGAEDPMVSEASIEAFKSEMETAGANYEFINYEGAKHAFTNPNATAMGEEFGLPLAYDAEADEASWNKLLEFLNEVFEK